MQGWAGLPSAIRAAMLALTLLCTAAGCEKRPHTQIETLQLHAGDGVEIAATRYDPIGDSPPGLILVHRLGAQGNGWAPFARRAQQAGYMAISFDLRGHGGSGTGPEAKLDYRSFSDSDWQNVLLDIGAAKDALLAAGADPENLFVAGEALGASLALQYAIAHPDIQGAILISPGLDYKNIDLAALIGQFETRPALLIWSEGDALAASSASTLQRTASGHLEVHAYAGSAHGADIFTFSPHAMGQAIVWLDQMRSARPDEKPDQG